MYGTYENVDRCDLAVQSVFQDDGVKLLVSIGAAGV